MFEVIAIMLLSQQPVAPVIEGKASYYTVASSGAITASGERLQDDDFTCAMRSGQFGEYYTVVGDNGKSVVVRLNDRGPYVKGRVIDLSEAAMRALGNDHLMNVKVYKNGAAPPGAKPN
jgi:rare lipoprotein A